MAMAAKPQWVRNLELVDGKGTNQDSLDMLQLSLNFDRFHAFQNSELIW